METAQRSRSIAIAREIAEEAIDAWRRHLFLGTTVSAMRATAKVEHLRGFGPYHVTRRTPDQIDLFPARELAGLRQFMFRRQRVAGTEQRVDVRL